MGNSSDKRAAVVAAYFAAESHRPYKLDADLIAGATPAGGDWHVEAVEGAITRSVMWGGKQVALMNPTGDLFDEVEGQISMAVRALPVLDAAMRAIIVLAQSGDNVALIRELATSVIAHVELPAPKIPEPYGDDEEDEPEEDDPDDHL